MMVEFNRRFLRLRYPYENPLDRQRASGLLITVVALFAIWLVWVVFYAFTVIRGEPLVPLEQFSLSSLLPAVVLAVMYTIQRGRLSVASWIFVLWLTSSIAVSVIAGLNTPFVPFLVAPVIAAGLLLRWRGVLFVSFLCAIALMLGAYTQSQLTEPETIIPADSTLITLFVLLSVVVLINAFFRAFGGNTQQTIAEYLQIAARYRRLNNFAYTGDHKDEYQAYRAAIELVRTEFGFVFAQVYLADEDGTLSRRVRAGRAEDRDVTVQVNVPKASTLNETVKAREPVTVTLADAPTRREHLLPSVSRGISLPIMNGEELIGVLDVQTGETLFTYEDQELLQAVADMIGTIVGNIRQMISLTDALDRQSTMMEHMSGQQNDPNRAIASTTYAWNTIFQRSDAGIGFDIDGKPGTITAAADLSEELLKSLKSGDIVTDDSGEGTVIVIPILLRGEVLGAMQFNTPRLNNRQIEIARKISDRLAQALENRRLFEQSQAQANRERKASEVATQLISATEVNAVLDLAATSFNEALGAVQTRIHIKPDLIRENDAHTTMIYPQVDIPKTVEKEGHDQ